MDFSESPAAPSNDTSTRPGEFLRSFPGALMTSCNTSARVRESTGPLGTNLTTEFLMAKSRRFKPGDRWFACNLDDQSFCESSS